MSPASGSAGCRGGPKVESSVGFFGEDELRRGVTRPSGYDFGRKFRERQNPFPAIFRYFTILAAGLIAATLSVAWIHCVIGVANDVVEALCGSRMCNLNCGHKYDGSSGAKQPSRLLKKAEQTMNTAYLALCKSLIYMRREVAENPISAGC